MMKNNLLMGLAILISINAMMLTYASVQAKNTCEEGEAFVCFDYNDYSYHIEENAQITIEVESEDYGNALVELFNEKHPDKKGALSYVVGSSTESDIKFVSLTQALFHLNEYYPLEYTENFALLDKVATEINYNQTVFVPMVGDGFAFITNLDRLSELDISLEDLDKDSLVDAVDTFSKIETVFEDKQSDAYILHLSLNEPYAFYPFLSSGNWQIFEENNAYEPGFEKESFLKSLEYIESMSDYKWNGQEALAASEYDWDYITAMEKNDFVFSMVASWMFVDSLEEKIEANWQVSPFPSMDETSEPLSSFLTNVKGYVVSKDVEYPSLAHEVLNLVRSVDGLERYVQQSNQIVLAPLIRWNLTTLEDSTRLQFAKALSYGQTEPLISFENDPTRSAFSLYYAIDIMPIIQRLWDGEISSQEAQIEICMASDEWLYQHELHLKLGQNN